MSFATVYQSIGLVLLVIVGVGVLTYVLVNVLFSGKSELGSEIQLAANRKPYYDDEELEGPKLERALTVGLLLLFVIAVGIPLYWIMEPGRQENAAGNFNSTFVGRGADMFAPTGDNLQALNCAGCHGGVEGGLREDFVISTPNPAFNEAEPESATNKKNNVQVVDWRAPALNTVLLRYSRTEVTFILTYGRPGSPMPAWGVAGGGPLNEQQVQNLIDFLETQQLDPAEAQARVGEELDRYMLAQFEDGKPVFGSEGEALFNMGLLEGNFASGAFSCARCHTAGWSYAEVQSEQNEAGTIIVNRDDFEAATANSGCGGALGPNLCDGDTLRQFPQTADHQEFVTNGSEDGGGYGTQGQGSGKMPGFGFRPAEPGLFWIDNGAEREPGEGMMTQEQIAAIVAYERGLQSSSAASGDAPTSTTTTTLSTGGNN